MSDKNQFTDNETPITDEPEIASEENLTGESWQDDVPPEDGFHDAETTSEDMIEEESGLDDSYDAPASSKDRGKTIFYGALGVAALLVGGMVLMQFTGGSQEAPPSMMMSEIAPAPAVPAQPSETPAAPAQGGTDLGALYQGAAPEPSAASSVMPDLQPQKEAVTTEIMTLADVAAQPAPPPALDSAPTVAKVENVPVAPLEPALPPVKPEKVAPVAAAPAPAPVPAPVVEAIPVRTTAAPSADVDVRLGEMADKIKTLEAALEQSVQKNAELVARLENLSVASNTALEERQAKLEQKRAREESAKAAKQASAKSKAAAKKLEVSVERPAFDSTAGIVTDLLPEEQVKEAMQQTEAKAEKKAVSSKKKAPKESKAAKAKETKAAKGAKAAKSSPAAEGGLVLRAATPDAAWVSGDSQSHDLQRVTVGESLPGVGKIKEIRQNGDSWELVGTEGTLK